MKANDLPARAVHRAGSSAVALLVPDLPDADELLPYLRRIDAAAWYTNHGPLVVEFERACERFLDAGQPGVRCVTASSGTSALEIALRASRLPPASRVLVPSFTFPATAIAVQRAGHTAVLCDVDRDRWVLGPLEAARLATAHACSGVVPVAAFGAPLDVDGWDRLAESSGLEVVVDGAGAFGSMPAARRVTIAYSLHATKPMGIGEGGLVATPSEEMAARVRRLTNYGFASGCIDEAGTNAKLSEYAAAVGLAQLARVARIGERRRNLWNAYVAALAPIGGVHLQDGLGASVPCNVVVRLPLPAERVEKALAADRIETRRWYCPSLHAHRAFAELPRAGTLRNTDDLARRSIGLPFHTGLSHETIQGVAHALARAVGSRDAPASRA